MADLDALADSIANDAHRIAHTVADLAARVSAAHRWLADSAVEPRRGGNTPQAALCAVCYGAGLDDWGHPCNHCGASVHSDPTGELVANRARYADQLRRLERHTERAAVYLDDAVTALVRRDDVGAVHPDMAGRKIGDAYAQLLGALSAVAACEQMVDRGADRTIPPASERYRQRPASRVDVQEAKMAQVRRRARGETVPGHDRPGGGSWQDKAQTTAALIDDYLTAEGIASAPYKERVLVAQLVQTVKAAHDQNRRGRR